MVTKHAILETLATQTAALVAQREIHVNNATRHRDTASQLTDKQYIIEVRVCVGAGSSAWIHETMLSEQLHVMFHAAAKHHDALAAQIHARINESLRTIQNAATIGKDE